MNYENYINSDVWKKKSINWRNETKYCEKCGSRNKLTCHHKNYKNLGHETRNDIMVLCWGCHKLEHNKLLTRLRVGVRIKERRLLNKITTLPPTRNQLKRYVLSKKDKKTIRKRRKKNCNIKF